MRILLLLTALESTLSAGLIADTGVFSYRAPIGQFTSYGSGTIFSGLLTSASPTANVPVNFGSTLRVGTLTYLGNSYTNINPSTPITWSPCPFLMPLSPSTRGHLSRLASSGTTTSPVKK